MSLHLLGPNEGATRERRRAGRGIGSGLGKTCGRGTKGQKARRTIHPRFEGGQTPIQRRLPVKKGFRNPNQRFYAIVNLDDLERLFNAGDEVTPEGLYTLGAIPRGKDGLKVLAFGDLTKGLTVKADKFSKAAVAKIVSAGGSCILIEPEGAADAPPA
jgi:large subunit ribosomal protein L15